MTKTDDKRHSSAPGLGGKLNGMIDRAIQQWGSSAEKRSRVRGTK